MKLFVAEEKHIATTINDFETFCSYIDQQRPKLSQRMEVLGKKDVFELNAKLFFRKDASAPVYLQSSYPTIDLMFNLAVLSGLYRKAGDDKAEIYLESTSLKLQFDNLNKYEKYCFLLETFWTKFDFMELIRWGTNTLEQFTTTISKSKPGHELVKGSLSNRSNYEPVFSYLSVFVHYFSFFGLCSFKKLAIGNNKQGKYDDSISSIIPTEFGVNVCKILYTLKLTLWNLPYLSIMGMNTNDKYYALTKHPFMENLKPLFSQNSLLHQVQPETIKVKKGNYTFKVMLEKSVWRKIKLSHKHTLEDLHLCIQEAFDFDNDHLYSFFMDGKRYSDDAYHSTYGDEPPFAEEAVVGKLELYKGKKILYLFDHGDSWEFLVQLVAIDENENEIKKPLIAEMKGDAPPQYRYE
ncbi:MAG TPA: plasmid pRiA4b ORF-3 family protein [Draconibacterium sp.]|nr:plasmid pRiA4b ORF-3 family protein [Draconibacterium sp.]